MTLLIIYLLLAIGVSFLCSILEAVLLSITPSFIEQKMQKQPRAGRRIKEMKEKLDQSISSILILNTFAHTMGAAGVGSQALKLFGERYETLVAVVLTLAILYFSEIIPKTLGATFWRQLASPSAVIIFWLTRLVLPLVWLSSLVTRVFGAKKETRVSRDEILAFTALGYKGGVLGNFENGLISNILTLRDISTQHILTPRTVVHAFDQNTLIKDALAHDGTRQFSRIPVYRYHIDDVVGFVRHRDMLECSEHHQSSVTLKDMAQPLQRVSQQLPVLQLIDQFIKRKEQIFLVEDEFGQTAGIVTLEDALETLLGQEIIDESDIEVDLQQLARRKFRERIKRKQNLHAEEESQATDD